MNHTPLRRTALGLLATSVLAVGMMASTAMAASAGFDNRMGQLAAHVKEDPNYKRIPLDTTSDRQWFYDESQALYTNKITKEQFVKEGAQRFPGYEASFAEVADFIASK